MEKYIGKMLDNRYEILEVIGSGGMAVVYKARCHRLNRFVAVKILREDYARDADFRRRFHAESQAVAMLSHPNIVAVYDVSRSVDTEYIVMELIDGITLKQYMQRKGVLNWREALHFTTQIVRALSHAHGRGIIHRDIKPHNIMILRDGSVKVADFGIARLVSVQNTLTQEALGSVHYISPEQARGSHIDARSDLYSVGVVMYETLTGRLPYEGDSPVSVAIQHINSMPLSPREINAEVPEALEVITMKAMSASLTHRYTSAEAMLHDLEEFRKNPSISFDYDLSGLHPQEKTAVEEPTRPLGQTREALSAAERPAPSDRRAPPPKGRGRAAPRTEEELEEEDYRARRRNSKITVLTGVLAVLVFVAGLTFLITQLVGSNQPVEDVPVPRLVGLHYEREVRNNSQYGENFTIVRSEEGEYSDEAEEGVILAQDPREGEIYKKGATVTVTLSLGRYTFQLLDYTNMNYREVQRELARLKLKFGEPEYVNSDLVDGMVVRTEPKNGDDVHEGDTIRLIVSKGPEVKMVRVPNLKDTMVDDLARVLEQLDLVMGVKRNVDSDKPVGTIVGQSVEANKEVEKKTVIDVDVSRGPAESPPPSDAPTPSEGPGGPTIDTTPSAPSDLLLTRTLRVALPSSPERVQITVYVGTIMVRNEQVSTLDMYYTCEVSGYVDDSVMVYIDSVQYEEYRMSDLP